MYRNPILDTDGSEHPVQQVDRFSHEFATSKVGIYWVYPLFLGLLQGFSTARALLFQGDPSIFPMKEHEKCENKAGVQKPS